MESPNVIIVVLDTARADGFEPYGAPSGASPAVAQLAGRGVAVQQAIAPANWTMPSHASMLTGLLPRTAGLSLLPGGDYTNCRPVLEHHRQRYLPSVLREAGYVTKGASTNLWVSTRLGFDLGFDTFEDLVGRRVRTMHKTDWRSRLSWYRHALKAEIDDGVSAVEATTERWLAERDGRPFFWFINLIECHSPYLPPRPYNDFGPLGRLLAAEDARRYQTLPGVWKACATERPPPRGSLKRMRHMYSAAIKQMDDWIGRLMERLDEEGVLDDTVLVVTSDHGENFGEGNLFGHAVSLDDRLIRVPLVVAGPGVVRHDGITSLVALPRLLAESISLDDHPWSEADIPDGAAVAQYDTGIDPADPRVQGFHDWGATEEGLRRFLLRGTCATDGRFKLVTLGERERVYDLAGDPLELKPLAAQEVPGEVMSRLGRALKTAAESEWTPEVRRDPALLSGDEELEERMRSLGYL